jgi:hypothetical protein
VRKYNSKILLLNIFHDCLSQLFLENIHKILSDPIRPLELNDLQFRVVAQYCQLSNLHRVKVIVVGPPLRSEEGLGEKFESVIVVKGVVVARDYHKRYFA